MNKVFKWAWILDGKFIVEPDIVCKLAWRRRWKSQAQRFLELWLLNIDQARMEDFHFNFALWEILRKFCASASVLLVKSQQPLIVLFFFFIVLAFRATSSLLLPIVVIFLHVMDFKKNLLSYTTRSSRAVERKKNFSILDNTVSRLAFCSLPSPLAILSLCFSRQKSSFFFSNISKCFVTENVFFAIDHMHERAPQLRLFRPKTRKNSLIRGFEVYEAQKSMKWSSWLREMLFFFSSILNWGILTKLLFEIILMFTLQSSRKFTKKKKEAKYELEHNHLPR